MRRRSVIRDTIQMTVIQFFLECLALLFNAWMTRRVGAATVGTLALAGSFFNLAAMVAGGNAMLCASRFVSEELGKSCGCPAHDPAECVCGFCHAAVGAGVGWQSRIFAEPLSQSVPAKRQRWRRQCGLWRSLLPLGSHQRLSERIFQCRVPCDSDSRL